MERLNLKSVFSLLLAAVLVGAAVYGIARLAGCSAQQAETFVLIAVVVGLLEKPVLHFLKWTKIVRAKSDSASPQKEKL